MPHIVIKAVEGIKEEQYKEAAKEIAEVIKRIMNAPERLVSVSFEEYPIDKWEGVFNEYIKENKNVLVKPGYTNPKTFE